jgi:hypothetical protein
MQFVAIASAPAPPPCAAIVPAELRAGNPLRPVWLPALFVLAQPGAGLRLCGQPDLSEIMSLARFSESCIHAQGPGFSGLLAFPVRGKAEREFCETDPAEAGETRPRFGAKLWEGALGIWRGAPAAARGLALAVPLMAPALYFGPKADFETHPPPAAGGAASSGAASSGTASGGTASSGGLAAAIRARATVDLTEDFQAGFDAWTGQPGWQGTWSLDSAGSAQPGKLALYSPSLLLTDYHLEFQGQIKAKAMGFVFRAPDTNNYQAVKLIIRKMGPQQNVALLRYVVIGGEEGPRMEFPLGLDLHDDTIYRLLVEARGPHFTVTLNGQLVDAWSEERLKTGGVGFFADKGEVARLRSVHIVDKQDFLGWLCSQVSQWTADRRAMGVRHE